MIFGLKRRMIDDDLDVTIFTIVPIQYQQTGGQRTDINCIINIAHLLLTRVKTVKSRRYALSGGRLK